VVIIPAFERSVMTGKKETIRELTNTVWSLLEEYHDEAGHSVLSSKEAKEMAASRIERIRYGEENKDYFWIINQEPEMIMHPYRSDLIGQNLTNYKDANGKKLFVEATRMVSQQGEGFIDYMWQWKDDSTRIVPKLSYVRGFEPWGWIVGTGIYLEDVRGEIKKMKSRLTRISILITLVIGIILLYVIRQSLNIEKSRKKAERQLRLSQQKYKSLVEASTEGTLMTIDQNIIFSNLKFNSISGYDSVKLQKLSIEDIFQIDWPEILKSFSKHPKKSVTLETQLKCSDNETKEVIASISKITHSGEDGYILIIKEISESNQIERETRMFAEELHTSLLLMNQPIRHFIREIFKCPIDTSISEVAMKMSQKDQRIVFLHKDNDIIGVLNDSDLRKRVLAQNKDPQMSAMEIMTAPVISIADNALLYEAILKTNKHQVSHLAVKNPEGGYIGVISKEEIAGLQQNASGYLIREIETAENIKQLIRIHKRLPVLVTALLESGDKTQNITRIISTVSDAIAKRTIDLALEELGSPPCSFAFMVMGSEGRREQTLATDQDNALVFADGGAKDVQTNTRYFVELGNRVSDNLHAIGYQYCKGEVMAKNPKWVQPLSVWKKYFEGWITNSDPKSIMEASIFFDFRAVYGDENLVSALRSHVHSILPNKAVFFYHTAQNVQKFKPPVSLFGNIISTEEQSGDEVKLDIKKILMPLIGFIRLYALHTLVNETNSVYRLKALMHNNIINKSLHDEMLMSYNYLMQLRFKAQVKYLQNNEQPENALSVNELNSIELATLKKILNEISNIQSRAGFDFKGGN
jgi:PAS domain S-box-containing protein